MTIVEMMTEIIAPIVMIELIPGPITTIKIGPSATFGIALSITRYGSNTFDKKGDHQRIAANIVPINVPIIKPNTVSNIVTLIWGNNVPSFNLSINSIQTFDGELKMSGSIHLKLDAISHIEKKTN